MKELIVVVGLILLGCILFEMIAGEEGSLRSASGEKMEALLQTYREQVQ